MLTSQLCCLTKWMKNSWWRLGFLVKSMWQPLWLSLGMYACVCACACMHLFHFLSVFHGCFNCVVNLLIGLTQQWPRYRERERARKEWRESACEREKDSKSALNGKRDFCLKRMILTFPIKSVLSLEIFALIAQGVSLSPSSSLSVHFSKFNWLYWHDVLDSTCCQS